MRKTEQARLKKAGYKISDTRRFLNLSAEEMTIIDLKINLIKELKKIRKIAGVTQKQLAKLMNSSQSRIAMLEGGSSDVSLELICKAFFALGGSKKKLGKTIAHL